MTNTAKGTLKINAIAEDSGPSKWQIEGDMRMLRRAEEVGRNRKRYTAAKKLAAEKLEEIQSVFADKK